jgi:hypothetical protein
MIGIAGLVACVLASVATTGRLPYLLRGLITKPRSAAGNARKYNDMLLDRILD